MHEQKLGWEFPSWFWIQQFSVSFKGAAPSQSSGLSGDQQCRSREHRAHACCTSIDDSPSVIMGWAIPSTLHLCHSSVLFLRPFPTCQPASPLPTMPSASALNINLHTLHCKTARALRLMGGKMLMAFSENPVQVCMLLRKLAPILTKLLQATDLMVLYGILTHTVFLHLSAHSDNYKSVSECCCKASTEISPRLASGAYDPWNPPGPHA